jgi:hypothetical protein
VDFVALKINIRLRQDRGFLGPDTLVNYQAAHIVQVWRSPRAPKVILLLGRRKDVHPLSVCI